MGGFSRNMNVRGTERKNQLEGDLADEQHDSRERIKTGSDNCEQYAIADLITSSFINDVPDAVIGTDLSFVIRFWNRAAERMYGWRAVEVVGKSFNEIPRFVDPQNPPERVLKHILRHGNWSSDTTQLRKDGIPVQIHASVSLMTDGKGNPAGLIGIHRDITELRESEERLRTITDTARDAIIMMDDNGKITVWNPAAEVIFGYHKQQAIGKELHTLIAPSQYDDAFKRGFGGFRETGQGSAVGKTLELIAVRKDGTEFPAELSLSAINIESRWNAIGFARDITERKQLEHCIHVQKDLATALSATSDLNKIFVTCIDGALNCPGIDSGGIFLLEKETAMAQLVYAKGFGKEYVAHLSHFTAASEKLRMVLSHGESIHVSYTSAEVPTSETGIREGLCWISLIPIKHQDSIIGVLYLASHGSDSLAENVRNAVEGIGLQIGGAITRVRATDAVLESEGRFRGVVENIAEGIIITDFDDRFLFTNPAASVIFGSGSPAELTGRTLREFVTADDLELVRMMSQRRKQGRSDTYELRIIRPDNGRRDLIVTGSPRYDNQGNIIGTIGVFRDITERKRAAEALQQSEEKYRLIAENAKDNIWVVSPETLKPTYVSPSIYSIIGYTPQEVERKSLETFLVPESNEMVTTILQEEFEKEGQPGIDPHRSRTVQVQMNHKDGHKVWTEVTASFLRDKEGRISGILGATRDITERKAAEEEKTRLEAQLRQAQKMEAIGTLAGGIAHDFNNILMAILGYAELVKMDTSDNRAASGNIDEILKAGKRARDLVRQILAFSRQIEQERRTIQPYLIVKEALKLLRASLPTTIEIRQKINTECGEVLADPTQIHQVLMNLCTNAHHAMREKGGILTVSLESVTVSPENTREYPNLPEGPYVRLIVSDTGCGMDQKTMERIFEPFFTTKPVGEGTGMGLATVHGIVASHGGTITVSSSVGEGTAFEILLPRAESKSKEEITDDTKALTGRESILLVDDEEPLALLGKRTLQRLGYNVTTRTSSVEALEAFGAQPNKYDLVITDQTMPNMTGAELAVEIMRIRPSTPVILITGYSEVITPEKAKQLGIRDYLTKPLVVKELGKAVRSILDQKTDREPVTAR